jgi:CxxC motif-containing protein (DUF1111 family)
MFTLPWLVACAPDDPLAGLILVGDDPPDAPLAGLSGEWLDRFTVGDARFEAPFREATGLGPVYVRSSCAACHADDARGPGVVEKFVLVDDDGEPLVDQSALAWGHTARPHVAGGATTPLVPPDAPGLLVTTRSPPAVFGRGWLEAVREDELRRVAEEQAAGDEGVSGRIAALPDGVGRFGLKARVPTLEAFAADALLGDMSITSPTLPDELPNPDGLADDLRPGVDVDAAFVTSLADYVRLLAIPERRPTDGLALFEDAGCATCHVPHLRTRADHPVSQLRDQDAAVFTDLLLHELGASDGLAEGDAGPSEWRTPPLMGLRHLRNLLHDGSADTVEDAILAHGADGSEALTSVDRFLSLPDADQQTLLTYVESL